MENESKRSNNEQEFMAETSIQDGHGMDARYEKTTDILLEKNSL